MCAAAISANPYIEARHVQNERYMSLAKNVRNWQLMSGGLLLLSLGLGGALVYTMNKQHVVPYTVEIDEAGIAVAIRELRPTTALDPLVVRAQLARFIKDIRTISTDDELVRRQMNNAYQICLEPAQNYLTTYYTENKIADLVKRGRVFPIHLTVSPISEKSWRVRWKEHLLGPDGTVAEETQWEATIEIAIVLPQNKEEREHSPLGLWIASLHWAPV